MNVAQSDEIFGTEREPHAQRSFARQHRLFLEA